MTRRDTIQNPAWRVQIKHPDGSVKSEYQRCTGNGFADGAAVRAYYSTVDLAAGETAEYQIRHPGKARFLTWSKRSA